MAKQFTLGKNERLKSRKSIEQLFGEGKSFAIVPFKVYYLLFPDAVHSRSTEAERYLPITMQFGVGVSSKIFKRAVERNRIKRLIRESYRLQKKTLNEKVRSKNIRVHVFVNYTGKDFPEYHEVYKKIGSVLSKLEKIIDTI